MTINTSISTDLEKLGYGGPAGCIAVGAHRQIITEATATRTLLAKESGSLCLFDRAAGTVYTLPAPVKGMWFEFCTSVACTSNAHKVQTDGASTFILGSVMIGSLTVADSGDVFQANGSSHVGISSDGATKGGLIGGSYKLVAISSTVWQIEGDLVGSGTVADPFV